MNACMRISCALELNCARRSWRSRHTLSSSSVREARSCYCRMKNEEDGTPRKRRKIGIVAQSTPLTAASVNSQVSGRRLLVTPRALQRAKARKQLALQRQQEEALARISKTGDHGTRGEDQESEVVAPHLRAQQSAASHKNIEAGLPIKNGASSSSTSDERTLHSPHASETYTIPNSPKIRIETGDDSLFCAADEEKLSVIASPKRESSTSASNCSPKRTTHRHKALRDMLDAHIVEAELPESPVTTSESSPENPGGAVIKHDDAPAGFCAPVRQNNSNLRGQVEEMAFASSMEVKNETNISPRILASGAKEADSVRIRLLADKVIARGSLSAADFTHLIHHNVFFNGPQGVESEKVTMRAFWLAADRLCPDLKPLDVLTILRAHYPESHQSQNHAVRGIKEPAPTNFTLRRDALSVTRPTVSPKNSKHSTAGPQEVRPRISGYQSAPSDQVAEEAHSSARRNGLLPDRAATQQAPATRSLEQSDSPSNLTPHSWSHSTRVDFTSRAPERSVQKNEAPVRESVTPISSPSESETHRDQSTSMRSGRLSEEEIQIVHNVVARYLRDTGLSREDFAQQLHTPDKRIRPAFWRPFITCIPERKPKNLREAIKKLYLPYSADPFSAEEKQELSRLVAIHGKAWKEIGEIMGRYREHCQHVYLGDQARNHGPWSEKECRAFTDAVAEFTVNGTVLWSQVSDAIGTRSENQCKGHARKVLEKHRGTTDRSARNCKGQQDVTSSTPVDAPKPQGVTGPDLSKFVSLLMKKDAASNPDEIPQELEELIGKFGLDELERELNLERERIENWRSLGAQATLKCIKKKLQKV